MKLKERKSQNVALEREREREREKEGERKKESRVVMSVSLEQNHNCPCNELCAECDGMKVKPQPISLIPLLSFFCKRW